MVQIYHLYSNAILVKTNISELLTKDSLFHKYNNDTELFVMRFKNEEKTEGYISRVVNIHMLPPDERRITETAVDFLTKDDYIIFFTSSVSYVYKSMLALENAYPNFLFEIIKHPFNFPTSEIKPLENFIKQHTQNWEIKELNIDNMFGFKLTFTNKDEIHLLNFYTNGLITFEMMNEKQHVEDIFNFILKYWNFYQKQMQRIVDK